MKMDEKEMMEVLESCSAMVLAVEELSKDMPKIKKMYQDGKKLLMQIKKEEKQLECTTQESMEHIQNVADKNRKLLEKMQQKIEKMQNTLEISCQGVLAAKELAEEFFGRMDAQEKRILELEKKMESLTKKMIQEENIHYLPQVQLKNGKILREVLEENHMQLPITVHRKNWTRFYCFVVREVKNGCAYGETYQYGKFYRKEQFELEKGGFELYEEEVDRSIFYALQSRRA